LRILVSNDDGVHARGIRVLSKRLAQEPDNAVYVVAPDRERSATGHSLTLHKPLRVEEVQLERSLKGAWSTSGTPSDCVKFAVSALLKQPPAVVISGINSGPNLGSEILYSGTVSAAMEGAFLNIPAIAVSLVGDGEKRYEVAAEFVSRLVAILPTSGLPSRTVLNVNVPNVSAEEIRGVRITELGVRLYNDYFEKRMDPRGKVYYWLAGHAVEEGEGEGTDVRAVLNKMISVTPLTFNMTDRPIMEKLGSWMELQRLVDVYRTAGKEPESSDPPSRQADPGSRIGESAAQGGPGSKLSRRDRLDSSERNSGLGKEQ